MAAGTSGIRIEVDKKSLDRLQRALEVLGEDKATWLREAWDEVGREFAGAVRQRAPGGIRGTVVYKGLSNSGSVGGIKARGTVTHPGARSMEFGRVWYAQGFKRPAGAKHIVGGSKTAHSPGQRARPFLGVMDSGGATADVAPLARARLEAAAVAMWARIAEGAND
jgi:hypothetical protein